jgi:hypothetical protein
MKTHLNTPRLFGKAAFVGVLLTLAACRTTDVPLLVPAVVPSTAIAAEGIKSVEQLRNFFLDHNRQWFDVQYLETLAGYYISEAATEGINSDVAFMQMCLETGFLRFGGLVTRDMNNFCGLGAIDAAHPGERFPTPLVGVRAHIQHLQAYGTTAPLRQPLVDPRYRYVLPRGKASDIYALSGTWAADTHYGEKLESLLNQLSRY